MGSNALTKMQFGKEGTSAQGTAVAADTIIVGGKVPQVSGDRNIRRPEENLGVRAISMRSWAGQYLYSNTLTFEDAYFELLPILFSLGVKGNITPSDGGAGDYTWAFTPSMTATNSPDSGTFEFGDDVQAYQVAYCMVERIKISGSINQGADASPITVEADIFGRQLNGSSFTAGVSLPTTEPMNAKLTRFYSDPSWAAVGSTEKTGVLRDWSFEIVTGLHPKFHGDQYNYFDVHAEGPLSVRCELTLEGNATADSFWDDYQAQTFRVLQFAVAGSAIGTGANHSATLAVGGTFDEVIPIASQDRDNNLHTAVFMGQYNPTGAKLLTASIVTDVAAI